MADGWRVESTSGGCSCLMLELGSEVRAMLTNDDLGVPVEGSRVWLTLSADENPLDYCQAFRGADSLTAAKEFVSGHSTGLVLVARNLVDKEKGK